MNRKSKLAMTVALYAVAWRPAGAQAPSAVALDVEVQNAVTYINDLADPSKAATSSSPVIPNFANVKFLTTGVTIGDIVSVNGTPAKGTVVTRAQLLSLGPNPRPGQAIADISGPFIGDSQTEILQPDGTPLGSLSAGFLVGSPLTGGTGAFLGARGMLTTDLTLVPPLRITSIQEDPANRRTNGGGRFRTTVYLIPMFTPEIVTTASGPAVVHSSDSTMVTAAKPAKSGEVLTLYATGLGPTRPALEPGKIFSANPLQVANSPIKVTVGGQPAEVLYAGGYPGTADGFQVNVRLPSGLAPGNTTLQLSAAFIPGRAVSIPVQ